MTEIYDTDFAAAVMQAATGDGAALAAILLSDRPLGAGERALLAELVSEERGRLQGRPDRPAGDSAVVAAVADYRAAIKAGEMEKNAAPDAAKKYGVSANTIRAWDRAVREREAALLKYQETKS